MISGSSISGSYRTIRPRTHHPSAAFGGTSPIEGEEGG